MSDAQVVTGKVAFSNVTTTELYRGKDTGKYSVVITMEDAEAAKVAATGVKLKEYEGTAQRRFTTQHRPQVIDMDDQPVSGELPRGSTVRVLWRAGEAYDGNIPAYLNKIRVVELAETEVPEEF